MKKIFCEVEHLRSEIKNFPRNKYDFWFYNGTVCAVDDHFLISSKSQIPFNFRINSDVYRKCLDNIQSERVEVRKTDGVFTVIQRSEARFDIYVFGVDEPFVLDIWDDKFDFHSCPKDILSGACEIVDAADIFSEVIFINDNSDDDEMGIKEMLELVVHENYINICTTKIICRYRLDFKAPFPMIIPSITISKNKPVFKKIETKRVSKVFDCGITDTPDMEVGLLFDLGDRRLLIYSQGFNKNKIDIEQRWQYGWEKYQKKYPYLETVENAFSYPCETLWEIKNIQSGLINHIIKTCNEILVEFDNKKITLRLYNRNGVSKLSLDAIGILGAGLANIITFIVDKDAFLTALSKRCLIGFIKIPNGEGNYRLYFRNDKVEYIVQAILKKS